MGKSLLSEKSEAFAVDIIKFYQFMVENKHYEIGRQILRSGTSIGANIAESKYAQSSKDFVSKLSIALKEANETDYWLKILEKSDIISHDIFMDLHKNIDEIIAILISSIKTLKKELL